MQLNSYIKSQTRATIFQNKPNKDMNLGDRKDLVSNRIPRKTLVVRRSSDSLILLFTIVFIAGSCLIGFDSIRKSFGSQSSGINRYDDRRRLQEWNPVKIGVADYFSSYELEEMIQAKYDIEIVFLDVNGVNYDDMIKPLLDDGKEVVVVLEFFSSEYLSLVEVIDGNFDEDLNNFIEDWQNDGNRELQIRPLHEMNGDWYSWGTFRGGTNTPENYILAFQHVHNVFKEAGANFKMQLCYNCESANKDTGSFLQWWPGEEYVDIILCDGYNRFGTSPYHTEWKSFKEVFGIGYNRMARLPGNKPLGAGETSTISTGGDKVEWIQNAFESLRDDFPRVAEMDFFFVNKDGPNEGDWGLNTEEEMLIFGEMINEMRGITVIPTIAPGDNFPMTSTSVSDEENDEAAASLSSDGGQ